LVAKRLAATGWHDHERVLAFYNAVDDLFLVAFEGVESEEFL
jgi:hypothetical protein